MTLTPVPVAAWGTVGDDGAKTFRLHPGQSDVLNSTARFTAAIAGTGGGKTAIGPVWIMRQIQRILDSGRDLEADPILGMVVAPTYKVLSRATAPMLVRAMADTDLEGTYVPTTSLYHLPGSMGQIWVLSADNPGGLEGGQFDFVWIDEGGQLKFDAWVAIQGRTGLKRAPVLITTTPYGQNWLFHSFYRPAMAGDRDYYVRQWASIANPLYPREEYERAKRTLSKHRAAMRYDGQFMKAFGLVYPDLERCKVSRSEPIPEGGALWGGIDFGWNDPFCALAATKFLHEDGRDIVYVWYERYKRFTLLGQHAAALPPGVFWQADPSRPDSINELIRSGHRVKGAYNDILTGIDAVSARIYSDRLLISEDCVALFAEAQEYRYPEEDDQTYGDKPIDEFNHALDALRYLVAGVDRLSVAKSGGYRRGDD